MAFKNYQILIFFGLVTITVQRQLRYGDSSARNVNDLVKLIGSLKAQPQPHVHGANHHATEHNHNHDDRYDVHHVNLGYKDRSEYNQRSIDDPAALEVLDRICKKKGKCCNGECQLRVDGYQESSDEEISGLLDELERDLTDSYDRDGLRCGKKKRSCSSCGGRSGLRCGCGRNRADGDQDDDNDFLSKLRCAARHGSYREDYDRRGDEYSRGQDYQSRNDLLTDQLERHGKKYRVSNDLDAIVVDLSELDGLLNQLSCKDGKCKSKEGLKQGRLSDLSVNGVNELTDVIRNVKAQPNVEAVIVDLSQVRNNNDLAKYLKTQFSLAAQPSALPNDKSLNAEELAKYYLQVKRDVVELISDYVTGRVGSERLNFLPSNVARKIDRLKAQVRQGRENYNSYDLLAEINRLVFEQNYDSKVLPHRERNNNVYIPNWAHGAVLEAKADSNLKRPVLPVRAQQKQSRAQKSNLARRATKADTDVYGVPFDLQIDGLGQVNP